MVAMDGQILHWADDADLEPHAVLQAVRDRRGVVRDFAYREVNEIACRQQRRPREDLLNRSVSETLPEVKRSGLLAAYAQCVNSGRPVILSDVVYHCKATPGTAPGSAAPQNRHYEMCIAPVPDDCISLRWRDITDRVEAQRRLAETAERYRLLAENSVDVVAHVGPDGVVKWVSPSVEWTFGAPPSHWVGTRAIDVIASADATGATEMEHRILRGGRVIRRVRTLDAQGGVHWSEAHAQPFHSSDGTPDGYISFIRLIDDQVAAEQERDAAREAQTEADARYRRLTETSPVATAISSLDGHFTLVNPAMCALLGYSAEALLTMTWRDITHPDDLPTATAAVADLIAGRIDSVRTTGCYRHADGHRVWGEISVVSLPDATGERPELAAQIVDITEQVEARAQLQAITDAMLEPQVLIEAVRDSGGRVVDFVYRQANPAACEYLGMSREELVGRRQSHTSPNLRESGLHDLYIRCLQSGEPVILDDFIFFNAILAETRRYDIRAARATADTLSVNWRDVTERFEARWRLAESEERYRMLALNSSDAVVHVRDGIAVWVSPAIEEMLGAPPERWVGTLIRDVVPPEDVPAFEERWANLEAGGEVQQRVRVISVDGVTHWVHLHAKPFHDAQGHRDGVSAALRLIDDEVAAEAELDEARAREARADVLHRRSMESAAVGMCLASPEGPLLEVNQAFCDFFGYDAETMLTKTWIELTAPEYRDADLANVADIVAGRVESYQMDKQFVHADGHRIWGHLAVGCVRSPDGSVAMSIGQIVDITDEVHSREQLAASEEKYRLIAENTADVVVHGRNGRFLWASPSIEGLLGAPASYWVGREMREIIPPRDRAAFDERIAALEAGATFLRRSQVMSLDGTMRWIHVNARPFRDANGNQDGFIAAWRPIDEEVRAENEAAAARRREARAEALYRRSVECAAVGMCLIDPTGGFVEVNEAVCEFFGYDADTLKQKTWQDLTAPAFLAADLSMVDDVLEGRRDTYRMLKQYIHADGHLIWGDLSVSCVRDEQGRVEQFISQIIDVTETVDANARNVQLSQRLRDDLQSAAGYMESILPGDLSGAVSVSSRYLPSRELGGDCFDYAWIDDDHLLIYLLDVSGHGIEPALLAVSVQNAFRSGTFATEILHDPAALLGRLNRMFPTEQQADHFFTIWYGVYELSTRTMRYASAGTPPAYAFSASVEGRVTTVPLVTDGPPIGVLPETEFTTASFPVPPGASILIFSDGASELPLAAGEQMPLDDFENLTTRVAGSPHWSLDDLLKELRSLTPEGVFADDVSLIQLRFD